MKKIDNIAKELKDISNTISSDDVKERINKIIKDLKNVQAEIYEDLNSFDPYSEGREEINLIVDRLKEKVHSVQYDIDNN